MKVSELIAKLQAMDGELPVMVCYDMGCEFELETVRIEKAGREQYKDWWELPDRVIVTGDGHDSAEWDVEIPEPTEAEQAKRNEYWRARGPVESTTAVPIVSLIGWQPCA